MTLPFIRDVDIREVYYPAPTLPDTFDVAVLPVDKPGGWSSFDVIRRLRPLLDVRKMGHAGTLDPLATGLLMILMGRATRLMERFMHLPKTYEATLRLGEVTDTYDADGKVTERLDPSGIGHEDLLRARDRFVGVIEQITPAWSAVKMGGERLYRKMRRGEEVVPPKRIVTVRSFEILERKNADVSFVVECSSGTYIRSLAHEFGQVLGTGAHIVQLRRTKIGDFPVNEAWTVDALQKVIRERNA